MEWKEEQSEYQQSIIRHTDHQTSLKAICEAQVQTLYMYYWSCCHGNYTNTEPTPCPLHSPCVFYTN